MKAELFKKQIEKTQNEIISYFNELLSIKNEFIFFDDVNEINDEEYDEIETFDHDYEEGLSFKVKRIEKNKIIVNFTEYYDEEEFEISNIDNNDLFPLKTQIRILEMMENAL